MSKIWEASGGTRQILPALYSSTGLPSYHGSADRFNGSVDKSAMFPTINFPDSAHPIFLL